MAISQQAGASHGGVEVTSTRGVVSAGHPLAADAGREVLAAGGNAIDAVVAGAFTAFVAEPNNAGIAGYGHLSAYLAADDVFLTVDHNPRAPLAATADMYAIDPAPPSGHDWPGVVGDANGTGPLAVGVPGAVAGLCAAHARAGRLPLADVLAPAVRLAEEGLEVTWTLLQEIVARLDEIRARPEVAALLLKPDGGLPRAATADDPGDRLDQRPLAAILRRIGAEGASAFYSGDIAEQIAAHVAARGGILTLEDLAAYEPLVFDEAPETYAGVSYVTSNDTVGYEALGVLAHFPAADRAPGTAAHLHLLTEAMGHAFADSVTYWGDPEHVDAPAAALRSPAYAAARAATLSATAAAPRPVVPLDPWPFEDPPRHDVPAPPAGAGGAHGTTQVVAADADGNVVALISTIGADFGCVEVVPGTGIVLNNGMANYDPRPGRPGSIAPGKMAFFAVPAIVAAKDGRGVLGVAGSGGYPILAGVLHTTVNALDHGLGIQAAIDAPRTHSQGDETYVDDRVPAAVRDELAALGHTLVVQRTTPGSLAFSRVSAVAVAPDGTLTAGAAPAWNTGAAGL